MDLLETFVALPVDSRHPIPRPLALDVGPGVGPGPGLDSTHCATSNANITTRMHKDMDTFVLCEFIFEWMVFGLYLLACVKQPIFALQSSVEIPIICG